MVKTLLWVGCGWSVCLGVVFAFYAFSMTGLPLAAFSAAHPFAMWALVCAVLGEHQTK